MKTDPQSPTVAHTTKSRICPRCGMPIIGEWSFERCRNSGACERRALRKINAALVAACEVVAGLAQSALTQTDHSGNITLAECMDEKGTDTFTIELTLAQANALADALALAKGEAV